MNRTGKGSSSASPFMGQPGDLVFCRNNSLLAWAIRQTQRTPGEPSTYANHVAGIVSPGVVLHALIHVVEQPLDSLGGSYEVWRHHRGLTNEQRARVVEVARSYKGRAYGAWKLAAHLGDWLLSWALAVTTLGLVRKDIVAVRRLLVLRWWPICSWVWAAAYAAVGVLFGVDPEVANPDEMHDHVCESDDWEMVFSSGQG